MSQTVQFDSTGYWSDQSLITYEQIEEIIEYERRVMDRDPGSGWLPTYPGRRPWRPRVSAMWQMALDAEAQGLNPYAIPS